MMVYDADNKSVKIGDNVRFSLGRFGYYTGTVIFITRTGILHIESMVGDFYRHPSMVRKLIKEIL